MDLQYLSEFIQLADTLNFLDASENAYISQSTLTKHIKKLEEELGVKLFNRTTRTVQLTEYGKTLYPYAVSLLETQKNLTKELLAISNQKDSLIRIGTMPAMGNYGILTIISEFTHNNPDIKVQIITDESDLLEEKLIDGTCDLAFIKDVDTTGSLFQSIHLYTDCLVAIFPQNHALASCEEVNLASLKNEDFIMLPKHSRPHKYYVHECEKAGFTPNVTYTDQRLENIYTLIANNMGVGLLMKQLLPDPMPENLSYAMITPHIESHITLCYYKKRKLSLSAKYFLSELEPH